MKILQISYQTRLKSGGAIQLFRLSKSLNETNHTIKAVMGYDPQIDDSHFSEFYNNNIDFRRMKLPRLKFNNIDIKSILKLRKYLKEEKFDIIHAHKSATADLVFLASLGLGIKFIVNRGVTDKLDIFQSLKYHTSKIAKVVAVSQSVKDVMVQSGKINPDKIEVVFGSVDTDDFTPDKESTLRQELKIVDSFVWGFAGNGGKRKGLKYLLGAFKEYHKKYPDDKLILIGVNETAKIMEMVQSLPDSTVIPLGFRKDMSNCMAGLDGFVFSGIAQEGLTGTIREAGASGLPVISTDVAGNRELVMNHKTGLLVGCKDEEAIYKAMCDIRENPEAAAKYRKNIRNFIVENMSNQVRMQKLLETYRSVCRCD